MSYRDEVDTERTPAQRGEPEVVALLEPSKPRHNYLLHIVLFILTFISTTYAGM